MPRAVHHHPDAVSVTIDRPVSALASFHYFRDVAELRLMHAAGLRLIADSGAFSAHSQGATIGLDEYAAWVRDLKGTVLWAASLDVIGNAAATWENYRRLRSVGLDVIPTVHYGATVKTLDRYADDGVDFVGLGGMVGRKSEPERLMRWCVGMFRYARTHHPGMRFHGWGVTHPQLLASLPWWSVDSSGWGSSYRYAQLRLFDPTLGRNVIRAMNGREIYDCGRLLRRAYGVEPETLARSHAGNRPLVVRVSARSIQLREQWLRARHQTPPPRYGVDPAGFGDLPTGTSIHIADSNSTNLLYAAPTLLTRETT